MRLPFKLQRFALLALPLSFALGGCVATQQDITGMEEQMGSLKAEISKLRETLESVQKNQADNLARNGQVQSQLSRIGEGMESSQEQLSDLSTRVDDLKNEVDAKFKALHKSLAAAGPSPSDLFHEAEGHLARKDYDLAVQGFDLYLKQNPSGSLADQARYLSAEAYLDSGRPVDAARAYAKVLDGFPKSPLTPSARLRYAEALLKIDPSKAEEARRYLESIGDDFPASPEAKKAQAQLAQLRDRTAPPASSSGAAPSPSAPSLPGPASSGPR